MYKITIKYRNNIHVATIKGNLKTAMQYVDNFLSLNNFDHFLSAIYTPVEG